MISKIKSLPDKDQSHAKDNCVLVPLNRPATTAPKDELSDILTIGSEVSRANAQTLLSTLGASSVVVREAMTNPKQLFQLVDGGVSPIKGQDGLVRGATWRSGSDGNGIKEFAKFKQVGQAAKIASSFFSQGMLIYIAYEINSIKEQISEIQNDLFNAEISRMKGCVRFASTSLRHYQRNHDEVMIFNAIQSIETEIDPLLDAIKRQMKKKANPSVSLFGTKEEELKQAYDEALSATIWLLKGMVALAVLYSVTDPEFGKIELKGLLNSFQENTEILAWLKKAGKVLSQNSYGEKYLNAIKHMEESIKEQQCVLSAPSCAISLTGCQLAELSKGVQTGRCSS